tara:strand:+ start:39 stop:638 length:600 start_codon:yes stop_codon:yes gene_type:complete
MDKIFPHHVYKLKVKNYKKLNEKLISEIYNLRDDNKLGIRRSNRGGWHSKDYFVHQDCNAPTELLNMSKIISNFYSENVFKNKKYIEVSTIWANINEKDNYNTPHTHPGSHYSGCYYVKVPKNSGYLYFINKVTSLTPPFNEFKKIYDEIKIKPEVGVLYLWSSELAHRVGKNKTDKDRISLSFNFSFNDIEKQLKEQE